MAITNKNRKIVHQRIAEQLPTLALSGNSNGGTCWAAEYHPVYCPDGLVIRLYSNTGCVQFDLAAGNENILPSPALAGTFGTGACAEAFLYGAPNGVFLQTATGGTTTSITTNLTLVQNLAGKRIRVAEGPNAGNEYTILSNTLGANATIYITTTAPTSFTASSKYYLMTGSVIAIGAGTLAAGSVKMFDFATNVWTSKSISGLPASFTAHNRLTKVHCLDGYYTTGNVASATSTTITMATGISGTNYNYNNMEVEILTGTGAGQVRKITSGGGTTTMTVSVAWSTVPDPTSTYCIRGDRSTVYLAGNGAVGMYRLDIDSNTWTTIAPTTARSGAPGVGLTFDHIDGVPEWMTPTVVNAISGQNGRFIYSLRGGSTTALDVYDIALNTWVNNFAYGGNNEGIPAGTSSVQHMGIIYIYLPSGRILYFNTRSNSLGTYYYNIYPQSTAVDGQKMFIARVYDVGGSPINGLSWIYTQVNSSNVLHRLMMY